MPAMSLEAMERALIQQALEDTNFDRDRAASILGVTQRALSAKLARLGIRS